ncbi:MAG: Tim44 domain-containing protein [Betaproteobacteria bacterium]
MKKLFLSLFACFLVLGISVENAEAARIGGGKSMGMQRQATPAPKQAPQAAPQPAPQATPATPAAQPKRNWMGPLAGLAAGIGLAALLSHFGLGEGMANILMIALLAIVAVMVVRFILRRMQPKPMTEPMQYAGIGGAHMAPPIQTPQPVAPAAFSAGSAAPAAAPATAARIPADFDVEGFQRVARVNFVRLQAANDAGNLADIREFTTPEMFAEIKFDIDARKGAKQTTDVVTLESEILEVVTEGDRHVASVRFHGMLREESEGAAQAFDEVWHLIKPIDGSRGWTLAGIQQLN